jgi:hypothetical protein
MDYQLLLQCKNFTLKINLISANGEIPYQFQVLSLSLLLSSGIGEMVEHIKFCNSSHSKHPDFDRFKGCVRQVKNVHSNQTGLKEGQMVSITHTHTYIYIYSCIYMNVYKS